MRLVTHLSAAILAIAQACSSPGDSGSAGPGRSDAADGSSDATADGSGVSDVGGDTLPPQGDLDFDEVFDGIDNCVGLFNPDQADDDGDGRGNICDDSNDDRDGDDIPNAADPFPDDAARPDIVLTNTVYAHTASELYKFGVKGQLEVELIGAFAFPPDATDARMTDIAIDRYGVMWGIGFSDVFVIDPKTARCWRMAALPQDFNGLTLVPREVLGTADDALVGVDLEGGWWRLELVPAATPGGLARITTTLLGSYGTSWQSSGDAFSIEGVGTYATIDKGDFDTDQLAAVDPATGLVTSIVAPLTGYTNVWGLAGWAGRVYGFDEGGDVLVIDLASGQVVQTKATGKLWWGAGVRTVLDE